MTPAVAQARVTQHGFDVIAAQLVPLLQAVLGAGRGGVAVIDVDKLLGAQPLQLAGGLGIFSGKAGARDLVLTFDVDAVSIALVDGSSPARIKIAFDHAQVGVQKGVVFGKASVAGFDSDAACHLKNGLAGPPSHLATFSGAIDLVLGVDSAAKLAIQVEVSKPVIHDLGFSLAKDCGLPECKDQFLVEAPCLECELCATGQLASDAANAVKDALGPLLGQVLEVAGNLVVKQMIAKGLNGKPLDLEVPFDLGAAIEGVSPLLGGVIGDSAGPLRVRVKPSPLAFSVQSGALHARFDGAVSAPAAACAIQPGVDATTVFAELSQGPPPPLPAALPVGAGPATKPIDVGLLVGRRMVEEAAWSVARSGLLCAAVDSGALYQLSAGKLRVSAGALDLALPGIAQLARPDAPVRIAVRPNARPENAPIIGLAQEASATVASLRLRGTEIGVEAFVHGRWLTLVELRADVDVVLGLQVEGPQLAVSVRSVAVPTVEIIGDPVAPGANWQALAPAVAKMGVSLLLAQPLRFDLDVQATLQSVLALPIAADLIGMRAVGAGHDWLLIGVGLGPKGTP